MQSLNKYENETLTISEKIQNNFFVSTLSRIKLKDQRSWLYSCF